MRAHIYAENDILHQTGVELVCLLYSEAIARVSRALDNLETGQSQERGVAIGGAMAIVVELQGSLDEAAGGQIAKDLARLYDYIQDRLITGHAERNAELLVDARNVLQTLLEGWHDCRAALDEPAQEPAEELAAAGSNRRAWTL
ncbi:MAG: flagellar protein FliS [Acidobacteria bacterium]|nr:flagellar protein FliS [Acidobacteriota bacterium]MDA1234550.1 flagellar protein FliS [Acidobacteriota bacterium]